MKRSHVLKPSLRSFYTKSASIIQKCSTCKSKYNLTSRQSCLETDSGTGFDFLWGFFHISQYFFFCLLKATAHAYIFFLMCVSSFASSAKKIKELDRWHPEIHLETITIIPQLLYKQVKFSLVLTSRNWMALLFSFYFQKVKYGVGVQISLPSHYLNDKLISSVWHWTLTLRNASSNMNLYWILGSLMIEATGDLQPTEDVSELRTTDPLQIMCWFGMTIKYCLTI